MTLTYYCCQDDYYFIPRDDLPRCHIFHLLSSPFIFSPRLCPLLSTRLECLPSLSRIITLPLPHTYLIIAQCRKPSELLTLTSRQPLLITYTFINWNLASSFLFSTTPISFSLRHRWLYPDDLNMYNTNTATHTRSNSFLHSLDLMR